MRRVLTFMSILTALTGAVMQGPNADSAGELLAKSVGGVDNCTYGGYTSHNCSDINTNCTAGTQDVVTATGTSHEDIGGNNHKVGNCTGNSSCSVTATTNVSSDGCHIAHE